jgi:hypothetical protein
VITGRVLLKRLRYMVPIFCGTVILGIPDHGVFPDPLHSPLDVEN